MNKQEYDEMVKAMKQESEGGNSRFWRPGSKKEGKFPIRILPPMKKNGEKVFYFSHKTHYIDNIPYECLNQTTVGKDGKLHQSESCPICNYVSKLYNSSERDSDEWKLASQLKARKRFVSRIVVRGKDNETEPEFYEYGPKIWEKLFNILTESEFGNIVDPKEGRDFIIHKSGTGRASNYDNSTPSLEKTPVFSNKDDLLKTFNKATEMRYDELIEFKTSEELSNALKKYLRGPSEEDSAPAVQSKEQSSSYAPPKKQEVNEYDEFEDDDEAEIEEDEIDAILGEFTN